MYKLKLNRSHQVFKFCFTNNIKLVYSATSASIGNKGEDKNLSLCFYKSKKPRIIREFKKWYNLKYEIIYFYNVYGPGQIKTDLWQQ